MYTTTPRLIAYRGMSKTVRDWAIFLGIPETTIRGRIARGLRNPSEILSATYAANYDHLARTITYNGKTQSVQKWAQELDLPAVTIHRRIKIGITNPETLLCTDRLASKRETIEYEGQLCLIKELAATRGISTTQLRKRLKHVSVEEALSPSYTYPVRNYPATRYTCNGETLTMREWAKKLGCTRQCIHLRLKSYPPEIALDPIKWAKYPMHIGHSGGKVAKRYACNGKSLTIREWAKKLGYRECTIYERLKKYPIEIALKKRKWLR
jgi:predicted DNA-binding transcriptional regulator AlpA